MGKYTELEKQLIKMADMIGEHFGPSTEAVVHDFKSDIDHSIIYIVNGEVTGRSTGDGPTASFIDQLKQSRKAPAKKRRLLSNTPDGRILRSSTNDYFDDEGNLINAFCINQDVTKMVTLQNAIHDFSQSEFFETTQIQEQAVPVQKSETTQPTLSIQELMDNLISEGISKIGIPPEQMNKSAKLELLKFLDENGVFVIQKSGQIICELLSISKFTFYNYLDEIRGKDS